MTRRIAETEQLERVEAVRIEAERRSTSGTACVSAERSSDMEETRIDADAAQLKQRVKPLRRRCHGSKRRGGRPQHRWSVPKRGVGKKGKLIQFVRK